MLTWFASYFAIGEDLVDVGVEDDVVETALAIGESVPRLYVEKSVVHYYRRLAVRVANCSPAVVVVFLDVVYVDAPVGWLVDEFDGCYYVGLGGVTFGQIADCLDCLSCAVSLCPSDRTIFSRVVETILGEGSY